MSSHDSTQPDKDKPKLFPPSFLFKIESLVNLDEDDKENFLKLLSTVHGG